ncbi:prostaglandin reductase 1-like [Venturia canescens]|uniref:prostaglandin reductase 1-like n=1 Tax=Venturia canescens TaxID=32260 RepID=UPI001C9CCBCB|nr:prostaglandin reductase 1-like [Venturia canescens]
MVKFKRWIIVKHFEGEPKKSDLKLVEEELPPIQDGEFMTQAEYLSVDPYMRAFIKNFPLGITMIGAQIAKITESKNRDYPVGKRVVGFMGWRTHSVINLNKVNELLPVQEKPYILQAFHDLPISLSLGVLGLIGSTAYFGLLEICTPKKGETLVVSGAAGAVGSHVGQIGKNLGLKVIGIAGTDQKCNWLTKELGFDCAINYKTQNVYSELTKAAPAGVDCYFDNVGGDISSTVIEQMNPYGRVAVCGSISSYNAKEMPKCSVLQPAIVFKQLKMEGFIGTRWSNRLSEGIEKNYRMVCDGKLKYRETVTEGFDKMFEAFAGMMRGENIGKAIVKV